MHLIFAIVTYKFATRIVHRSRVTKKEGNRSKGVGEGKKDGKDGGWVWEVEVEEKRMGE